MQLPEAEELVTRSRGRTVILLNPEWTDTKSVPNRHGSFVGSFETVYCFQPIAIQVGPLAANRPIVQDSIRPCSVKVTQ